MEVADAIVAAGLGKELPDNHWIAGSGNLFGRSAESLDIRHGIVGEFFDVVAMFRRCADAGNLDPFLEFGFEFVLHAKIVPQSPP